MLRNFIINSNPVKAVQTFLACISNVNALYYDEARFLKPIPYLLLAFGFFVFCNFSITNESRTTWVDVFNKIDFQKVSIEKQQKLFEYFNIKIHDWNEYQTNLSTFEGALSNYMSTYFGQDTILDKLVRSRHGTTYADDIAKKLINDGYEDVAIYFITAKEEDEREKAKSKVFIYVDYFVSLLSSIIVFWPLVGWKTLTTDFVFKDIYVYGTTVILIGGFRVTNWAFGLSQVSPALEMVLFYLLFVYSLFFLPYMHFKYVSGLTVRKRIVGILLSPIVGFPIYIFFVAAFASVFFN